TTISSGGSAASARKRRGMRGSAGGSRSTSSSRSWPPSNCRGPRRWMWRFRRTASAECRRAADREGSGRSFELTRMLSRPLRNEQDEEKDHDKHSSRGDRAAQREPALSHGLVEKIADGRPE